MARILLMEDDLTQAELLGIALDDAGHECVPTTNAKAAWQKLQEEKFDLVITDIYVPGNVSTAGGGISLIHNIRMAITADQIPGLVNIPILAISGMAAATQSFDPLQMMMNLGVDRALAKPISLPDLLSVVEELLEGRQKQIARGL